MRKKETKTHAQESLGGNESVAHGQDVHLRFKSCHSLLSLDSLVTDFPRNPMTPTGTSNDSGNSSREKPHNTANATLPKYLKTGDEFCARSRHENKNRSSRNLNLTDRQAVESARQLTTDLRNKKQEKTRYWHVTLGMWSQCILGKFTFRYPKRGRKKKAVDMGPTSAASVLLRALHADKNNVFFCRDYLVVGIRRETLNETDTTGKFRSQNSSWKKKISNRRRNVCWDALGI
ncbi:hypothetical protein RUM44_009382 [Polyplax serrata]|uniref:Uncharacterized protein n=1 Tax=Polyplax serrata TaxID=468196 RepID=A0ABR1ASI9_POLSC